MAVGTTMLIFGSQNELKTRNDVGNHQKSALVLIFWPFRSQNNCFTLLLINPFSNILVLVHSVRFNLHGRLYHNANFCLSKWEKKVRNEEGNHRKSTLTSVFWPFGSQNNCFTLLLINPFSNILVVVHSVKFNLHGRWYHNANFCLSKWEKIRNEEEGNHG